MSLVDEVMETVLGKGIMTGGLRQRVTATLSWMVTAMKWREDDLRENIEEGSCGGYSEELTEAIELLEELGNGQADIRDSSIIS